VQKAPLTFVRGAFRYIGFCAAAHWAKRFTLSELFCVLKKHRIFLDEQAGNLKRQEETGAEKQGPDANSNKI
jgi:hypothetical protein